MKKLFSAIGFSAGLTICAMAQGKPTVTPPEHAENRKEEARKYFEEALSKMPAEVAVKVQAAREAAKAAKADVEEMVSKGKSKEEIESMIAEKRAAARQNLDKALEDLDKVPEQAKESVAKAREKMAKRLADRQEREGKPE